MTKFQTTAGAYALFAVAQPEVVKAMGEAYDLACEVVPDHISREILAKAILKAAREGERDPVRLCSIASEQATRIRAPWS